MSSDARRIPSGSQTVGPYFRIGLEYRLDLMNSRASLYDAWRKDHKAVEKQFAAI